MAVSVSKAREVEVKFAAVRSVLLATSVSTSIAGELMAT